VKARHAYPARAWAFGVGWGSAEPLEILLAYYNSISSTTRCSIRVLARRWRASSRPAVKMAVLTNKPVRMSRGIVEALGVDGYFERYGGNSFEQKKPHPIGVETLLAECDAPATAP